MVNPLLFKAGFRHLQKHPWQTWLTILGIALGVAVVVAVDLANQSAKRSFSLSLELITGTATHAIVGNAFGIDEQFYTRLRTEHGLRSSAPLVTGHISIRNRQYRLLGIDLLAQGNIFRSGIRLSKSSGQELFLKPNRIAISRPIARELGLKVGDSIEVGTSRGDQQVEIVLELADDSPLSAQGIIISDISVAQELLGKPGRLDQINLVIEHPSEFERLNRLLPDHLELQQSASAHQTLEQMTAAFHTNLAAMSLLALLVGGFLIYNTITFMVLQRRHLLGTFRALGVTRGQLFLLVLGEAALLGLVGILAGLVMGVLLGQGLVHLVTRTINDLYYSMEVTSFLVSGSSLLKGTLLGLLTSLAAALLPAIEAARSAPVSVQQRSGLHQRFSRHLPKLTAIGLLSCGMGLVLAYRPGQSLSTGFFALAIAVLGFSLVIPQTVRWLSHSLNRLPGTRTRLNYRIALRGVTAGLSRTGLAITALTIAVATTIGVGIMINSFRTSVDQWLQQSLNSDLYITIAGRSRDSQNRGLPQPLIDAIQQQPGVSSIWQNRITRVRTQWGEMRLMAISNAADNNRGFNLKSGDPGAVRKLFFEEQGVLISEPLAMHRQLAIGDSIVLHSATGEKPFTVLGIFYDYTSSHGLILMAQSLYQREWQDYRISALGLYRKEHIDPIQWQDGVRQLVSRYSSSGHTKATDKVSLEIRANSEIRSTSLAIFDRTFTITQVLRLLSIIVAFIGVLSALMALQLERTAEFAVLRATGVTPRQIRKIIFTQTGLMGAFAGLLAIPLGYLMSSLLIDVINLRSFGWSMGKQLSWSVLLEGFFLAVFAALLAGIYPARHGSQLNIARALRDE